MPLPESISLLLSQARRRLLAMGLTRRLVAWVGAGAALAAGLVAVARHVVLPWAEPVALFAGLFALLAAMVVAVVRRPSPRRAALEVDRRLGGYDRVSTALELTALPELDEPQRRQVAATSAWSDHRSLEGFGQIWPGGWLPKLAGLAVVAVALLALIPAPSDIALAERRAEQQLIEEEANRLEELAEEAPEEVAEQLRELAERLRRAESLEQAIAELGEARQQLAEQTDPTELARKTALAGLERRLEQSPLAEGENAADQLRSLAQQLSEKSAEELAAAAEQLGERAGDLAGIDQPLSEALAGAAQALQAAARGEAGAADQAAQALERAADELERAAQDGEAADARSDARAAVRDAQARLDQARQQQDGDGQGPGQGQGQGLGQGQTGQGQGGQGQGGPGGGQGSGGQSGIGSTPGGTGAGQVPSGSGDDDPARDPARQQVFDPIEFGLGDEVRVPANPDGTPGDPQGTTPGSGVENLPLTPYAERYVDYQRTALDALDTLSIPTQLRDLVRLYFTELEP